MKYDGLIALYARFVPHDTAHLIELMGGNVCKPSPLWYPAFMGPIGNFRQQT